MTLDLARPARCEPWLAAQQIAGGALLRGLGIYDPDPTNESAYFQLVEVAVQRCPTDLAITRQSNLRREAAKVRVEPVAKMPEHDFGGGLQPALLDSPIGGVVAHCADLREGGAMRVVKP
jgi:hypothetical protein